MTIVTVPGWSSQVTWASSYDGSSDNRKTGTLTSTPSHVEEVAQALTVTGRLSRAMKISFGIGRHCA